MQDVYNVNNFVLCLDKPTKKILDIKINPAQLKPLT